MREGKIRPFYLLYGNEGYLLEKALKRILATLLPSQFLELNFKSLYAEETPPQEVISACNTLPFIAQRRVILVKHAHKYRQSELRTYLPYLKSPTPTTSLVFMAEGQSAAFLGEVREGVFYLRQPFQQEIPLWIRKIAKELGKDISSDAAEYVQEATGRDLQAIRNELFKAALYVGDKNRIELRDVEQVVSESKSATTFELTKALGERNLKRALRILGNVWEGGEHHLKILSMIARQFRYLLMAKEVLEEGGGEKDLKERLGISNPYFLRQLSTQAKGFSHDALINTLLTLRETDMSLKRTSLSRQVVLEELVIKLCKPS